jgi:hypothetical protein
MNCPRCFYLAHRHNVKVPPGYPFTLNSAVDKLLKAEFDIHRNDGTIHPLVAQAGLSLVPFQSAQMVPWRQNRKGIEFQYDEHHLFCGVVDDVWQDLDTGKLHVADYKATAKATPVTTFEPETQAHHRAYARQLEFYTWLLHKLDYEMGEEAYLFYATGDNTLEKFDNTLHFRAHLLMHRCDLTWIEPAIQGMLECYAAALPPEPSESCAQCAYVAQYQQAMASI